MAHGLQTSEPKGEVKSWEGKMVARLQTGPMRMLKTATPAKSKLDELGPIPSFSKKRPKEQGTIWPAAFLTPWGGIELEKYQVAIVLS